MLTKIQIITLLKIPKIGRKKVYQLHSNSNIPMEATELYEILRQKYKNIHISKEEYLELMERAKGEVDELYNQNIEALSIGDENYPELLMNIPDPPVILYIKGNSSLLTADPLVAVIGTREPSDFGKRSAFRFGELLADNQIGVVSGLARGCDEAAHRGCLEKNGKTVAVLAHGLDRIYPKENKILAEKIAEEEGALISEYQPGVPPHPNQFVDRDRIQSGISIAILVVETAVKGGTMHTVNFAEKQNRIVYCLDHPKEKRGESSKGNQLLLSFSRALPIADSNDLINLVNVTRKAFQDSMQESEITEVSESTEKVKLELDFDELAERLGVKKETIRKNLNNGTFNQRSKKRDPQKLDWNYNESTETFYAYQEIEIGNQPVGEQTKLDF